MPPAEHIIFFFKLNYYYLYSDNSFITRHIITSRENDFFDTSWWKLLLKNELNGLSWVTLKIILVSKVHVFSRYFRSRIEATIVSLWILNPSTIHKYIEPPITLQKLEVYAWWYDVVLVKCFKICQSLVL